MDREALPDSIRRWTELLESGTTQGLADLLSDDVVVHSPLTNAFTFDGKGNVVDLFDTVVDLITGIRYFSILSDGDRTWALMADAIIDGEPMQEALLMKLDDAGLIRDITLFGRPLPSLTAVMKDIAPPLLAKQGRALVGRATVPGNAPLALITKVVERHVMPRLAPRAR